MFLYEKKIVYLSFFREGIKSASAGFIRLFRERDMCRLDIHIKCTADVADGEYGLFLVLKSRELPWGSMLLGGGEGKAERSLQVSQGKARFAGKEFEESEVCGILLRSDESQWISGYWQEPNQIRAQEKDSKPELRQSGEVAVSSLRPPEERKVPVSLFQQSGEMEISAPSSPQPGQRSDSVSGRKTPEHILGDKWEQLQRSYRVIHPFGDGRRYLSIEPKDFVVLRSPYQRLVNNSFLLHGFYNYRHLILGPDEELGAGDEICDGRHCFYLGVPGTYFEREKMVAVMFGFEGFECSGPVEIGKFGYYMRRVEL